MVELINWCTDALLFIISINLPLEVNGGGNLSWKSVLLNFRLTICHLPQSLFVVHCFICTNMLLSLGQLHRHLLVVGLGDAESGGFLWLVN